MNLVNQALKLASEGFCVFPLTPGTKIPLKDTSGLLDATRDPDQIKLWWKQTPNANIGIRTGRASGITVVDVDAKSGGLDTLHAWSQYDGSLTDTFQVQTAGGGYHFYFKYDPDLRQTAGLGEGVDVRSDGGYVVGPGSVINGKIYQVEYDTDPAPLPAFYTEQQKLRSKPKSGATEAALAAEGAVGEGGRNAYLTKIAGALRRQGLSREQLESVLRATNEETCDPPLEEREVATIARSNARYEPTPDELPASTVVKLEDLKADMNAYLLDENRVKGEKTGLEGLDQMLGGGLRLGEITALHAEAKTGKNTIMHRVILELLRKQIPVGYASRELSPAEEVLPNLLSIEMKKNLLKLKKPVETLPPWPLFFAHGYGEFPLEELQQWVLTLSKDYGVQHFFLDHLHYMLMTEDYQQAARLIKVLKSLAKKLKVQMFIIIQPTKVLDGQELGLNTLKGGSAIGQTIDNLLTLKRVKDCGENITELALTHARSKIARPGKITLQYDPETMDLTEGQIEPIPEGSSQPHDQEDSVQDSFSRMAERARARREWSNALPDPID